MLFCGIDIGTTNTKALLVDGNGLIINRMVIGQRQRPDMHRIDAQVWYQQFCNVMDNFCPHFLNETVYVSLTTQGASFALLDKDFKAVAPAWVWTGHAASETVKLLELTFNANEYYAITGWQPLEFLVPCKLREYDESPSNRSRQFHHLVTVPDYIISQLAQRAITDITNAQMTGLFDIQSGVWREDICRWAHCGVDAMSSVVTDNKVILENIRTPWGKINLTTSSHDQYAAMTAAGIDAHSAMLGSGTAWALDGKSNFPVYDNTAYIVHPGRDLQGGYGFIATLGAVGQAFEKLLRKHDISYEWLTKHEKHFDLTQLPNNFVDIPILDLHHDGATAVLFFMQAIAAQVLFCLERLEIKGKLQKLIMTGGATQSSVWTQILADVCMMPVETIEFPEFTAMGAVLLAKHAVRQNTDGSQCFATGRKIYQPSDKHHYTDWYANVQRPYLQKKGILLNGKITP
jgi:sugar (pentulose or hexulose) kinase